MKNITLLLKQQHKNIKINLLNKNIYKFSNNSQNNTNNSKEILDNYQENVKQTYIQEQEQLKKERESAHDKQIDLTQILKPQPLDLKFEKDKNENYIKDYTDSPTVFKFNQSSQNPLSSQKYQNNQGLTLNTDSEFQVKDNPLAMKILSEGQIDLADKRINVGTINISDQAIFGDNTSNNTNIQAIDLGNIVSNKKDSVLLEDIDVFNIPEDKDIIIEKKEKKMQAIGIKVKKQNTQSENDQNNENNTQQQQERSTSMAVSQNIFEEKDLQEQADEDLFKFEKDFLYYDWGQAFRTIAKFIPFYIVIYYFIESLNELYSTKHDIFLMEEQEMQMYTTMKKQNTRQILLNDPRFDRKTLLEQAKYIE